MNVETYMKEDMENVLELKKMALQQLKAIELCLHNDSIEEATARGFHLFEQLRLIRKMKHATQENKMDFGFLMNKLQAGGTKAHLVNFGHEKTD